MTTVYPDPTLWGATRTTTFTTTTTATVGQVVFFAFPTLATPQSFQYTILSSPTSPSSVQYPDGLPILVLTQVDGIIVGPSGQILTTATIMQTAPKSPMSPNGEQVILVPESSLWRNWTQAQRGGVIAGIVFSVLGLIAVSLYLCHVRRKRKKIEKDMETGPRGDGRRTKNRTRRKEKIGPRGIAGLAGVEMGPAAMRTVHENMSSRPPTRRSGDSIGVDRTNQLPGRARRGAQYQMAGALQGDDMQRAPVGQRPLLPPNQQYLPSAEPGRVGPAPIASV